MSYRFDRHHAVTLGFLSLIETLNPRLIADCKVGRFHKRPGQILIPVLSVAAAFAFTIADLLTAYTPTVRSEVAHTGKSPHVSGLQHDRQRQNLPDTGNRLKKAELSSQFDSLSDSPL